MKAARLILRALSWAAAALAVLAAAGVASYFIFFPRAAPPDPEPFPATPERLARGRYLVEHVATCLDCHSPRDWAVYSGPPVKEQRGAGGPLDFLGSKKHAPNITPEGLRSWTDGEIARAVAAGVNRDGEAVYPMMPWDTFAGLTRKDLESVVIYLRALPPVAASAPEGEEDALMRVVGRLLPEPYEPPEPPPGGDMVARGRYLARLAECGFCHRSSMRGGAGFRVPGGPRVVSGDLRPREDGPAGMSREGFIGLFKSFAAPEVREAPVPPGGANTVMPWVRFSGMTEEDLGAIYDYLETLPPAGKDEG